MFLLKTAPTAPLGLATRGFRGVRFSGIGVSARSGADRKGALPARPPQPARSPVPTVSQSRPAPRDRDAEGESHPWVRGPHCAPGARTGLRAVCPPRRSPAAVRAGRASRKVAGLGVGGHPAAATRVAPSSERGWLEPEARPCAGRPPPPPPGRPLCACAGTWRWGGDPGERRHRGGRGDTPSGPFFRAG